MEHVNNIVISVSLGVGGRDPGANEGIGWHTCFGRSPKCQVLRFGFTMRSKSDLGRFLTRNEVDL
jgi:hypothetical protein